MKQIAPPGGKNLDRIMANPKKRRKIIIFLVIVLVLVGGTLAAVFRKREAAITIQTDKVTRRSLT